jgi:hypothetical protein
MKSAKITRALFRLELFLPRCGAQGGAVEMQERSQDVIDSLFDGEDFAGFVAKGGTTVTDLDRQTFLGLDGFGASSQQPGFNLQRIRAMRDSDRHARG